MHPDLPPELTRGGWPDYSLDDCTVQRQRDFAAVLNNLSLDNGSAVVHGATVGDGALIGMGAIVMNGAIVGEKALIAAGSVVKENTVVEPRTLWAGVPARKVRELPEAAVTKLSSAWEHYVGAGEVYAEALKDGDSKSLP